MTRAPLQTDRRAALRSLACVALAAPLISACDATDTTASRATGVRPTAGSAAADAALVVQVGAWINAAMHVAERGPAPAKGSWTAGLVAMHTGHLKKLGVAARRGRSAGRPAAHAAVVANERRLQQRLVEAAQQARSGALAQVLASMAAAIEQRLVGA